MNPGNNQPPSLESLRRLRFNGRPDQILLVLLDDLIARRETEDGEAELVALGRECYAVQCHNTDFTPVTAVTHQPTGIRAEGATMRDALMALRQVLKETEGIRRAEGDRLHAEVRSQIQEMSETDR